MTDPLSVPVVVRVVMTIPVVVLLPLALAVRMLVAHARSVADIA